jgi:hypothetical protein
MTGRFAELRKLRRYFEVKIMYNTQYKDHLASFSLRGMGEWDGSFGGTCSTLH